MDSTRIDKWLCAVRVYKTRSQATEACDAGHVSINDKTVKPASTVQIGDRVSARIGQRSRDLEVVAIIEKRVGAAVAATCFVDHTLPVEREPKVPIFVRDAGTGRPTKKDRRLLDRLRQ
jgi:ribosome-associated heat shock protein Hsp15